jgi:hypothetical protein
MALPDQIGSTYHWAFSKGLSKRTMLVEVDEADELDREELEELKELD